MNFNQHLNQIGRHATFSPSSPYWIGDDDDNIVRKYINSYMSTVGTILHDIARKYIEHRVKMSKHDKKAATIELLEKGIPETVVSHLAMDDIFSNITNYVNDCISLGMSPEVVLYYSDNFFGTADAISFDERNGYLRIHDLKTGVIPAKMEQLMIYNALFALEYGPIYGFKAEDLQSELRIYQGGEIIYLNPEKIDIKAIADRIVNIDNMLNDMQTRRSV